MTLTETVFWLMAAAVAAPLLAHIPIGIRFPVVVIEVVLGIVLGPHVLALVHFQGALETMFKFSMAVTLFMAGMEADFSRIRGKPLTLALGGWAASLLIGFTVVALLHVVPQVHTPMMVTLALCTTGLGVLLPIFRDGGQLDTDVRADGHGGRHGGRGGADHRHVPGAVATLQHLAGVGVPADIPGHRRRGLQRWAWACAPPRILAFLAARCTPAHSCRCAFRCCCWSA